MIESIPGDTYDSPEHTPRCLREYLMLGTRWSPYTKFFGIMFRSRALAVKGLYDDKAWAASSFATIAALEQCGAHFRFKGIDKVRAAKGPVVFISNHMSTLETFILPGIIAPIRRVTYVIKKKLNEGLVWGPIMRSRDPIAVTREDPRVDLEIVLNEGTRLLGEGMSIIVFPQGTRTDVFDPTAFNSLGIKLAAKAGVPVIPVAVKTDYWGNSPVFRGFGPIRRNREIMVEFGEEMTVSGRGKAEHEKTVAFIESRLRSWGAAIAEPKPVQAPKS